MIGENIGDVIHRQTGGSGYNCGMNTEEILSSIDAEIAALKRVRAILTGTEAADGRSPKAGRKPRKRKRKKMSAEARAKIAAAQKKRWAAIRNKKA